MTPAQRTARVDAVRQAARYDQLRRRYDSLRRFSWIAMATLTLSLVAHLWRSL